MFAPYFSLESSRVFFTVMLICKAHKCDLTHKMHLKSFVFHKTFYLAGICHKLYFIIDRFGCLMGELEAV